MSDGSDVRQHGLDTGGRPLWMSDYLADWWEGVVRELGFRPAIVQGSWMVKNGGGALASAGFHDKGGALDLRVWDLTATQVTSVIHATRIGGAASWVRDEAHGGFDPHIHLILGSDFDLATGAAWQWLNYVRGGDGLGDGTGRDYHWRPGPIPLKPPDHYLKGLYDMTPEEVRQVVREEFLAFAKNGGDLIKVDHDGDPDTPKWSLERRLRAIDAALVAAVAGITDQVAAGVQAGLADAVIDVNVNIGTKETP